MMGRKALLVACWLTISGVWGEPKNAAPTYRYLDSVSPASSQRLFRDAGAYPSAGGFASGAYPSAGGYAPFFQLSSFLAGKPAASQFLPTKQQLQAQSSQHAQQTIQSPPVSQAQLQAAQISDDAIARLQAKAQAAATKISQAQIAQMQAQAAASHSQVARMQAQAHAAAAQIQAQAAKEFNAFLKDSYGNKFAGGQNYGYKTVYPQQYVQIQDLPAHLAHPLVAVPSHSAPQYYFGNGQTQATLSHPVVFGQTLKPPAFQNQVFRQVPAANQPVQQQAPAPKQPTPLPQAPKKINVFIENPVKSSRPQQEEQSVELQQVPNSESFEDYSYESQGQSAEQQGDKGYLETSPAIQSIKTLVNGKKTTVQIETKPPLPLLDLDLLEPLKFEQPLVPQIQSFLPKIKNAKYHTLPDFLEEIKGQNDVYVIKKTKKTYGSNSKKPKSKKKGKKPGAVVRIGSDSFSKYNSKPKVTVTEIPFPSEETYEVPFMGAFEAGFNKFQYGKPMRYNFMRSSKEPVLVKTSDYANQVSTVLPQLVYNTQVNPQQLGPEHRGQLNSNTNERSPTLGPQLVQYQQQIPQPNFVAVKQQQHYSQPIKVPVLVNQFQPITPAYEINTVYKSHGPASTAYAQVPRPAPASSQPAPLEQRRQYPATTTAPAKVETATQTKENASVEAEDKEHTSAEESKENNGNSEEDFEKSYKQAAYGFPAYEKENEDTEDEVYNPEAFVPKSHGEYEVESPFAAEGDAFTKATRLSYKEANDKTKEDYFLDLSVNKPESLLAQHKSKVQYYKAFKNSEDKPKAEKYTASSFSDLFPAPKSAWQSSGPKFEFDFSKDEDNSAFASKPRGSQVSEPQFEYGFAPIPVPVSRLDRARAAPAAAAPADADGTRTKVYQENFYIKKTSIEPAS